MRRIAFLLMLGCGTKEPVAPDAAGVDAAPLPARGGAVTVVASSYTVQEKTFGETTVSAAFTEAPIVACIDTRSTDGTCVLTKCSGSPGQSLGAGTLTVSGLSGGDVVLSQSGTSYPPQTTPSPLFAGGEAITVNASGGDLATFSRAVTAPSFVTLTAPAWPTSVPLAIARGKDLVVAWQGSGTANATAFVAIGAPGVAVRCEVPAKTGTLSVPSVFVDALPVDVVVTVGTVARDARATSAGNARAALEVTAVAARAGGSATGAAILQ